MKTNKFNQIGALIMLTLLGACGGNNAPIVPYGNTGILPGMGNCLVTPGPVAPTGMPGIGGSNLIPDQTVIANLNNGATLTLYLQSQPGGGVAASGRLVVPSVSGLYQTLLTGISSPATGDSLDTCVTSNGSVGVMEKGSVYDDIEIALLGQPNIRVELGSRYGVSTYVVNGYIEGSIMLEIPPYPATLFGAARPGAW